MLRASEFQTGKNQVFQRKERAKVDCALVK